MAKNKLQQSEFSENKSGYIPFILLFLIGLIKTETMTYHQKVFKTLLIIISAFIMIIYYFIDNYEEKKVKLERLTIFFGLFFLIFFIQYIVSYFSGEISYDRNYYLANYASLLIFAFFTYLYFKNENDLKKIFILIPVFLIILSSIAGFEFINYYTYPNRIDNLVMEQQLSKNLSPDEYKNLNQYYRLQSGSYRVNRSLSGSQKSTIHSLLKKSHYYTIVNPTKILSQYRPPLTFGNTNYLAAYLIALLPLAFLSGFALYDRKKKFINNYLSIICFFGAIAGTFPLILTQTTSAFFGIYLSIIFIVFPSIILTSTKLNRLTKIILISLTFLILFILPIILLINAPELFKTLAPRLVTKTKAPLFALYDRLNGWTPAWNLFLKHPITGAGLGTVYAASFQYISKYFNSEVEKGKITKEDLKYAHTLEQSINYFRKWIKDNIVFCSWGKSDFIVLKNNCEFYNIDTNWIKNYIDIQNIYVIKYELKNLVSLRNVVKLLEIENDKKFHKALNDAFYTGEIMKKLNIEDVSKYFIE